jgi:hypothetical protein
MAKEILSSMEDDEDKKCEDNFRFTDHEDEDDHLAYFKGEMEAIMGGSSTYSGKMPDDNPYNLYFDDDDPKDDNTSSKYFGTPVKKNRSSYNLFIKDKVCRCDHSFRSATTARSRRSALRMLWKD